MGNIAEGFERGGNNEFVHFLAMAKGSAGEVRSHAYVALDHAYLTERQQQEVADRATEVSRMLAGLMRHLKESSMRGSRYKE
jgi:four helix bundle protein